MDNHNASLSSFQREYRREEETAAVSYRSQIAPRTLSKNNIVIERFHSYGIPLKPGGKSTTIVAIQENREREKRELSDLNDRFASYIERVRFLETQNKQIQLEIDHLRRKWGSQTSKVKETYEVEISEARHIIDNTTRDRTAAELRAKRAEEDTLKFKEKYEFLLAGRDSDREQINLLQKQITDNEADLNLFRRRLNDLEDEQKRYRTKSQKLILDIQRITKDLNQEIIVRVQLENEKQSLEEEKSFLKEIHSQEIEELKQTNLIGTTLDPTKFFKHELSNAVKNIREEYEQLNHQQANELESWYRLKVTQALQEIQSHRTENIREQEEIKKLRTLVSDSQDGIVTVRQRNGELNNRIQELEELIKIERQKNIRATDDRDRDIKQLRAHLEDLGQNYNELISTNSSLDSEITVYRKILEGEEKRVSLKQVEEQARTNFSTVSHGSGASTYSYSRSYQRTNAGQGIGYNAYVPWQSSSSSRTESTIFEQVYGSHRRRPAMINLNVQWVPADDRSSTYRWNRNDFNNRNVKKTTLFGNGPMREQRQPKAITPPSSDYTDAYLSAFAPKPIPPKYSHRLNTTVFANVPWIPFKSTDSSIRTSETRYNNNIETLNSFDSSSAYSSSFIPDISTDYKPSSSTQYSSPQPQKFNSNSTTSRQSIDRQRSDTIFQTPPRSPSSIFSTTYRSESPYENIYKPMPPYSSESYPPSTTSLSTTSAYKPFVSFQTAPQPFSNQSSTSKRTVLPSLDIKKQIDRPKTLLFQHDEDIRSSCIEKPSPIISPLLESPIIREEPKRISTEELSTASSKPVTILENTLGKYDSIINQISEILANVSPLSSTISSMSPGKSVLDYELSSDSSPTLQYKRIESHPSQQPTTTVKNTDIQSREDSYDKIGNAIAEFDTELTPTPVIEEENDKVQISSFDEHQKENNEETEVSLIDEQRVPSIPERVEDETRILLHNEHPISSITREHKTQSDTFINELPPLIETKLCEQSTIKILSNNPEFVQQQTGFLSNTPNDKVLAEETGVSYAEASSNNRNEKRVTWDETATNNQDDESSFYQNLTAEGSLSETPNTVTENGRIATNESAMVVEQQLSSSTSNELQTESPILSSHPEPQIKLSIPRNQDITSIEHQIDVTDRQTETPSTFLDFVDQQSAPSDLMKSRSSSNEQLISSITYFDTHSISAVDERSITTSNVVRNDNINKEIEELESTKEIIPIDEYNFEFSTPLAEDVQGETRTLSSSAIIIGPINIPTDSIAPRYISSDVYHGYLATHTQNISDSESANKSLLASLRQNIATSATPLIETIQSAVSSMQIITAVHPLKNDREIIDHNRDKKRLTTIVEIDSIEVINEDKTHIEENKPTFAISEAIVVPNLLSDRVEVPFSSKEDQIEPVSIDKTKEISLNDQRTEELLSQNILSTPITQNDEQVSSIVATQHINIFDEQEILKVEPTSSEIFNIPTTDQTINKITSTITSDAITNPLTTIDEEFDSQTVLTGQNISELKSPVEIDEFISDDNILLNTIQELIENIIQSVIFQLQQNQKVPSSKSSLTRPITLMNTENRVSTIITPSIDNAIQKSANELESDPKIEIGNIPSKLSFDYRELSPTNTEADSLELIHALRGHSIVLTNSLLLQSTKQSFHPSEKSSSSTTSSQITSSDRYVSYAIHEMGDSSQERLPALPKAADIPIYKSKKENLISEPIVVVNRSIPTKEDDSTEFDATENLTSYSDDILLQRLYASASNRHKPLDTSSTDDDVDVDDEFEQHDLTNIHQILDQLTQESSSLSGNGDAYQRYDLATTPSSNDSSSSSRQQTDNVYLIPGYPGLWRPSADNDNSNSPIDYDADDERKTVGKTRTIVRTSDSAKLQSFFQHHQDQTTNLTHPENTINIVNHPLNEHSVDTSELDSFQTCPSSLSKQHKPSEGLHQTSPDENIFLIRERERGVSLPVTMKIDYDNMALRLSTSTPIDTLIYSPIQPDLSSPSTHSEPPLPIKTNSNSLASSPSLSSNESDQQKMPSWLNTVNTVTTTTEGCDGPLESRTTLLKSAKGPISISECDPQGSYIMIENTSRSKNIDLSNWRIRQENDNEDILIFIFPDNCLLRSNHSIKIFTKLNESKQKNGDLIASSLSSWHTGPNSITTLINPEGKDCATLTKKTQFI